MGDWWWSRGRNVSRLLRWLVRQGREHGPVSFATIRPHRGGIVSFSNLVVFERIELILDMNRSLLDDFRAKEGVGNRSRFSWLDMW